MACQDCFGSTRFFTNGEKRKIEKSLSDNQENKKNVKVLYKIAAERVKIEKLKLL